MFKCKLDVFQKDVNTYCTTLPYCSFLKCEQTICVYINHPSFNLKQFKIEIVNV